LSVVSHESNVSVIARPQPAIGDLFDMFKFGDHDDDGEQDDR